MPVENLLGEIGKGHVIAFNILNIGRWKLGVGTIDRNLLPAIEEEGDTLRTQLSILKRLTRYTPANIVGLKRMVAEVVLEKGGYVC